MNNKDPSAPSENRSSETEASPAPRGLLPGTSGAGTESNRQSRQSTAEPKQLKIVLRVEPAETPSSEPLKPLVEVSVLPVSRTPASQDANLQASAAPETSVRKARVEAEPQQIPARMLNEFVYCQRLFYYEFVEGVFVESADTLRGGAIHQRVDSGNGAMPKATGSIAASPEASPTSVKSKTRGKSEVSGEPPDTAREPRAVPEPEIIHSRSVQMGSERLRVVAKMDLVEVLAGRATLAAQADVAPSEADDLFSVLEVCPVDYKAGAPREGEEANELWDTDKMQLGLQALILRDNGYTCNEGVIYYRATKQRVRLPITPELESWILQNIADAKWVCTGPIPAPLVHSPKCVRCSLAPVCLPDETRMLAQTESVAAEVTRLHPSRTAPSGENFSAPSASSCKTALIPSRVASSGLNEYTERSQGLLTSAATKPESAPRRLMAARDDTRSLYLNTPGYRVGCKDEVLQVKDKDRVIEEVRMRDVSHVALFGNIQISTQAIQSLCEQEIPVTGTDPSRPLD